MKKLKRLLREALLMLLLIAGVVYALDSFRAPQAPLTFADQQLQTIDGETVTLAALSDQRPLLVYFWASWCGICRYTTPAVAAMSDRGANVISVALRSGEAQNVTDYLQAKGYRLPVVNDEKGILSSRWQVGVTPTLVIINKGEVVSSTTGWTSSWGMKLRLWWAEKKS